MEDRSSLPPPGPSFPGPWSQADSIVLAVLVLAAALTRCWRLWYPDGAVFDEIFFVGQAGAYLRGEQFIDPHPPLAAELIALGMRLFGAAHSWSWRLSNAAVGTSLVGITYLLARRMFGSRLTAALAASFILCDGAFLVDSRVGVPEIVYLTLAALAYLLLFRFMQNPDAYGRRRTMLLIGIVLGLCLGAKLLLPAVAVLLVVGFLCYAIACERRGSGAAPARGQIVGALLLVGSTTALAYAAVFLPNILLLRWGGLHAMWQYLVDIYWYERGITIFQQSSIHDQLGSPWWSWALMLHPFIYRQDSVATGELLTIWFGEIRSYGGAASAPF